MGCENSNHWIIWKCSECKMLWKTPHSNIPKKCKCGNTFFKCIGREKQSKENRHIKRYWEKKDEKGN